MATIVLPLLIAIAGAFLYAFASNPKLCEIGRLTFFAGVFWVVYLLGGKALRF